MGPITWGLKESNLLQKMPLESGIADWPAGWKLLAGIIGIADRIEMAKRTNVTIQSLRYVIAQALFEEFAFVGFAAA